MRSGTSTKGVRAVHVHLKMGRGVGARNKRKRIEAQVLFHGTAVRRGSGCSVE